MGRAVLAAWLCIAALALLTMLLVTVTSFDPVVLGIVVSGCALLPLYWVDRQRAVRREMTTQEHQHRNDPE